MEFRIKDYVQAPLQILRCRLAMKRNPKRPRTEMEACTLKRLRALCCYAYRHVPYYRDLFTEIGLNPEEIETYEDFRRIPVMDKDTVRQNYERLQSDELEKLGAVACTTSGSTGTAMRFYLDRANNSAAFALFWRIWETGGAWNILKKQANLSIAPNEEKWSYNKLNHILYLSSFHLDEATAKEFYDLILEHKPAVLRGYPSALYLFAKLLKKQGLSLHFPILMSMSETLQPFQREYIEGFFGGKIINSYTHWERTASICECMEGNLHAENDFGYHEILDADGNPAKPMEQGRLVCTGLYNRAMPLIRYDTRDLAQWSDKRMCRCGSHFPIVDFIFGRIEDVVLTPEGRLVGRLGGVVSSSPHIKLAHLYQPDVDHLIAKIVPDEGFSQEADVQPLLAELRRRLGDQIDLTVQEVAEEEIPRSPAGKVRFVVSDVPNEQKLGHR